MITSKFQMVKGGLLETQALNKRKASLRTFMKKRRADNENRDVKEMLLIENFWKAVNRLFGNRIGAGTRRTYFCYLSFSSEAPTDKLIENLLCLGNIVCCPKVENGKMVAVELGEDFTLSNLGIREPVGSEYDKRIDCVIAPLLAVDKQGNRLGYGGGFYDTFFKEHPNAKRIGYCFDFQIVDDVPFESWDERLDCVVTDKQVVYTERNKRNTERK